MTEVEGIIARHCGGYDPPILPVEPHPFSAVEGIPCCAECGGGILHEVHLNGDAVTGK